MGTLGGQCGRREPLSGPGRRAGGLGRGHAWGGKVAWAEATPGATVASAKATPGARVAWAKATRGALVLAYAEALPRPRLGGVLCPGQGLAWGVGGLG